MNKLKQAASWLLGSLLLSAILASASAVMDVNVLKSEVSGLDSDVKEIRADVKTILMYMGRCR
jgi:hypothetical protein